MTLEIEQKLEDFKSDFQHIQVFKTKSFGLMLVLDGAIQVRTKLHPSSLSLGWLAHPSSCSPPLFSPSFGHGPPSLLVH